MGKRFSDQSRLVVIAVFLAILLVGLFTFDDYGLSCDEIIERQSSVVNYRYINRVLLDRDVFSDIWPTGLSEYRDRYYGVAMQLPLVLAEDVYALSTGVPMPSETIYLMRHLYTFLVYYFALICFYLLLKRLVENRWLALCGVLMLYLFGQFFAHSFYNIKDLLFASLFMISLCLAERVFATNRKPIWCLLFALSGALLVSSRIIGALLIVLTLVIMLVQDAAAARRRKREPLSCAEPPQGVWKRLLPYLLVFCAYPIWILVTPAAWRDPIGFSLGYAKTFSSYQDPTAAAQNAAALAAGAVIVKANTRFYFIKHIAASVPVVNQLLAVIGIGAYSARAVRRGLPHRWSEPAENPVWAMMLSVLLGTLLYQAVAQPNVYDGWRHGFYLYPMIVAFAVYGLRTALALFGQKKLPWARVAGSLAFNAARVALAHPYEYAMQNVFSQNTAAARERDYWRSTYYDLIKWVLADADGAAKVCLTDPTGGKEWIVDRIVLDRLGSADTDRLTFTYQDEAEYVLQNYAYMETNEYPIEGFEEVYAIWLNGWKLAAVSRRIAP